MILITLKYWKLKVLRRIINVKENSRSWQNSPLNPGWQIHIGSSAGAKQLPPLWQKMLSQGSRAIWKKHEVKKLNWTMTDAIEWLQELRVINKIPDAWTCWKQRLADAIILFPCWYKINKGMSLLSLRNNHQNRLISLISNSTNGVKKKLCKFKQNWPIKR